MSREKNKELAEKYIHYMDNIATPDCVVDDFFDYVNIEPEYRTDQGYYAIVNKAIELLKEEQNAI